MAATMLAAATWGMHVHAAHITYDKVARVVVCNAEDPRTESCMCRKIYMIQKDLQHFH